MDKKISVIVPVYKVEEYLCRCVDSIINQTYKNLEIILVDDGSPDGCGKICDEYAERDSRIKVIHKENGGPSSARNAGLDAVTGDYIGFVDSDDYIDPAMYEHMISFMQEHGADIVVCNYRDKDDNSKLAKEEVTVLNQEEALNERLVTNAISDSSCDKLYKSELWFNARFPIDRMVSEDSAVIYKVIFRAQKVVGLNKPYYKVFEREDSLTHKAYSPKWVYTISTYEEMVEFFNSKGLEKYKRIAEQKTVGAIFFNAKGYLESGCKDKTIKKIIKQKAKEVIKKYKSIGVKNKLKLLAVANAFFALKLIFGK